MRPRRRGLLVTRAGKPLVVLVGVENKDREDWSMENSPDFWRIDRAASQPAYLAVERSENVTVSEGS